MQATSRRAFKNEGFHNQLPSLETPAELKEIKDLSDKDARLTKGTDDSGNLYDKLQCEEASPNTESNRRFKLLVIIACLISIVSLLVGLVMLAGEGGSGCNCPSYQGQF